MNKIILTKLIIKNFGKIANAEIDFDETHQEFSAENESGKTTLFSAYKFVLGFRVKDFEPCLTYGEGKDLKYVKIGTLENPIVIEATAFYEKDNGLKYTIKRVATQTWAINKNTGNKEISGYTCKYYFDSATDISATAYCEKVGELFGCPHKDLEIATDIGYFNSVMDRSEKRKWLFEKTNVAETVKQLADKDCYSLLRDDLLKGKDEVDINRSLKSEKSNIDKELTINQSKIESEQTRLAEYSKLDFETLKAEKEKLEREKDSLLTESTKTSKNNILSKKIDELQNLTAELNKEKISVFEKQRQHNDEVYKLSLSIDRKHDDYSFLEDSLKALENQSLDIALDIEMINSRTFDEHKKTCPMCQQSLPIDQIDKLITEFESNQAKDIAELKLRAEKVAQERLDKIERKNVLVEEISALEAKLKALKETVIEDKTEELENQIAELKASIENIKATEVKADWQDKIEKIKKQISDIDYTLGFEHVVKLSKQTIQDLKAKNLELAKLEQKRLAKQEQLTKYVQEKIRLVNSKVNSYFDDICFNFFVFNGAKAENPFENTVECCYQGIKYDSLSDGAKIFANIAVKNGIERILGISTPCWIDRKECLTKTLPKMDNQIIELKAVENKKLDNVVYVSDVYDLSMCVLMGE